MSRELIRISTAKVDARGYTSGAPGTHSASLKKRSLVSTVVMGAFVAMIVAGCGSSDADDSKSSEIESLISNLTSGSQGTEATEPTDNAVGEGFDDVKIISCVATGAGNTTAEVTLEITNSATEEKDYSIHVSVERDGVQVEHPYMVESVGAGETAQKVVYLNIGETGSPTMTCAIASVMRSM